MWNPKWQPTHGCDGRLKVKILITTTQVNLCCLLHVSLRFSTQIHWIVVIKIFAFSLPTQPFLGRHFGFHISFHNSKGRTLFLQLGCFGLDFTSFCNCILWSADYMFVVICSILCKLQCEDFNSLATVCRCISFFYT